jgi:DNA-binding transcriptional ArsR family regulator
MPEEVILDRAISDGACRLYGCLVPWATWRKVNGRPAGVVPKITVGQLAADLGKSHPQTRRLLGELRAAGHVTTEQLGRGGPLRVQLLWISVHVVPTTGRGVAHG